jgi:STE24 endopeptidase
MTFDANAATARYIDSLGPAALEKAHHYTVGKEWMLLWSLLVAAVVTLLIVRSGLLERLQSRLSEKHRNLSALTVAFVYFIVSTIIALPWSIYSDW